MHPQSAASNRPCRYRLLALDLDGTLFDRCSQISPQNAQAVLAARQAGLTVTICTGRGLAECRHALETIAQAEPVVVAGGALIACPRSSRTLHRFPVDAALVATVTRCLLAHRHPALVLKDPLEAGHDYLVITGDDDLPLDPVTHWWFREMNVRVRFARSLDEDQHPEHTVRVGACGRASALAAIKADLLACLADQALMHHFPAVVAPDDGDSTNGDTLHVLEVFHRAATKWSAVMHLASGLGIDATQIAAIGDEINDIPMIQSAGLGIAMANAVPQVRAVAAQHTLSNDDHGVAYAIGKILEGSW